MDSEQIKSLIEQLKAQGLSEDEIMNVFYETFTSGDMDRKDLETLAEAMGYELTDDFKNEEAPDPIAAKDVEGLSKDDLEDAKAIEPGESVEEFKENIEDAKKGLEGEEELEKSEEKSEEVEDSKEDSKEDDADKDASDSDSDSDDSDKDSDEGSEDAEEGDKDEPLEESEEEEWEKAQKLFKI